MSDAQNALAFERVGEPPGIEVIDRIEQQRYSVETSDTVEPRDVSADDSDYPVGSAVEFETSSISFPTSVLVMVRDDGGGIISRIDHDEAVSFPDGTYTLEISAQIKTYIDVEAEMEIETTRTETSIYFDHPVTVRYGARSRHEHPAGSVTTTEKPRDVMAAIETFGSSLKTVDPERSYPTLRGHPPTIELGEELDISEGLEPPENGITLELPLDLEYLYVAAPLAFYLGASIEPGPEPRLVTDEGFEYPLNTHPGFQTAVSQALQQVFFFDCITRTEGLYQMPLDERKQVEPLVDIDFADLYDRSMSEQVASYLDVPFSVIHDFLPDWPLTTHVEPTATSIEQLPFIVDDLAIVQSSHRSGIAASDQPEVPDIGDDDVLTRSAGSQEASFSENFVQPGETDAVEQAWIGDEIPIGASKLTAAAFRNRVDRQIREGDIEIAIVLNDDRMDVERDIIDSAYGDRDQLPFDVSVFCNTTRDELRELLSSQQGFLHYIGHTEPDGFVCDDGKLDASDVAEVGIDSFLLNACNSYQQGLALIEGGAIAGIVTLADIINQEGVNMGEAVAKLLNAGFPLNRSLSIARNESIQGGQYIVVGDGGMSVTQPAGQVPTLLDVEPDVDGFDVTMTTYTTKAADFGTVIMPHLQEADSFYIASNTVEGFSVSREEFAEILEIEEMPIRFGEEIYWSSSIDIDSLI